MRIRQKAIVCYALSALVLGFILIPIFFMALGGFMPESEIRGAPGQHLWFVKGATSTYYAYIFTSPFGYPFPSTDPYITWSSETVGRFLQILNVNYFLGTIVNSVVVATTVAITNLVLGSLAAFSFARIPFRGRTAAFVFILLSRLLPPVVLAIPYYILIQSLGLLNNLGSVVLIDTVLTLPFSIWYLVLYFRTIPVEIEEASLVDGASLWQTLRHISMRLSGSGLWAITLFSFILSYDEFLFSRFLLGNYSFQTVPVYVGSLSTSLVIYFAIIHGVLALSLVPMVIIVLIFRKFINLSQLAGAIKT